MVAVKWFQLYQSDAGARLTGIP